MLHIHYGREDRNKESFLYDTIEGQAVVLVPDQYTVQAERDAFFYSQEKVLMQIEILSFSRLADRVFSQAGGGRVPMIDKQGRHMLLTRIMRQKKEELKMFAGYSGSHDVIDMVNDFIAESKQFGRTGDEISAIAQQLPEHRYLRRKLEDMALLLDEYQRQIQGKYMDTEDRITQMMERMDRADIVMENVFWIYGFDYFSPRTRELICRLAELAPEVHVVMTADAGGRDSDLFRVTEVMIRRLREAVEAKGIDCRIRAIDARYRAKRPAAMQSVERELYALPVHPCGTADHVQLVAAGGPYEEAETAAAEILRLVREKGMRYKDIAVICNDLEVRGRIARRVFAQYGLELYVDEKRSIMDQPAVECTLALLDSAAGSRTEDVIRMVKTGLSPLTQAEGDRLEEYCRQFGIRGSALKKPFEKNGGRYDEESLAQLEAIRGRLMDSIGRFEETFKKEKSAAARTMALYRYLAEDMQLREKINEQIEKQTEAGLMEAAQTSAQVWNILVNIMDQMVEVLGEERISLKDYAAVFRAGCAAVEVGLLPPVVDGLVMGTMQRTRTGDLRALFVLGANEGVLPAGIGGEGIFSAEEKKELDSMAAETPALAICKEDAFRTNEEDLAIYRNLSKPEDLLYVSWSGADAEGKPVRRSPVVDVLRSIFPAVPVKRDLVAADDWLAMVSAPGAAMVHLTGAVQEGMRSGQLDDRWRLTLDRLQRSGSADARMLSQGLQFAPAAGSGSITPALAGALYGGEETLTLSASRLERFGRCPFAHFVRYGLRPEEVREYKVGSAELGDVYHRCLQQLTALLNRDGMAVSDPASPWQTMTREEADAAVDGILASTLADYREGLFASSPAEVYRGRRVRQICRDICWTVIDQVRRGRIQSMHPEIRFGRHGAPLPPVKVTTDWGDVLLEGIIDRVDRLDNDEVKVIDYKSGKDKYSEKEAVGGWKLQLFIYLKAACGDERMPAGAYYFHIDEPMVDASGVGQEEIAKELGHKLAMRFRMDGFTVAEKDTVEAMDKTFGTGESSGVIPAERKQNGELKKKKGRLLSRVEMTELTEKVDETIDTLCRDLRGGGIRIAPRQNAAQSACTYCGYRGICKFDPTLEDCRYIMI
ncbi:MAG: PD-(D/E)XK nuclease family protein [Eubacteriales bacterium]|nr:PD-(D/E)XK nuclease family protein [Eubacteriales bacterium]